MMNSMQFFQNQTPQISALRSWTNAPLFCLPQSINDPFVVKMHHYGTDSFSEETQESRQKQIFLWYGAPQALHPPLRTPGASAPSPRRDPAAPLTIHTRTMCPMLPTKKPPVATWFWKPSTGMPQKLCFSEYHLRTFRWLLFNCPSSRGCDVIPLRRFPIFLHRLALCSHLPSFSGFGLIQCMLLRGCFFVTSSTLLFV